MTMSFIFDLDGWLESASVQKKKTKKTLSFQEDCCCILRTFFVHTTDAFILSDHDAK